MGDPQKNIQSALKEFYGHYEPNGAPDEQTIDQLAKDYVGKEKDLWKELYGHYAPTFQIDDATYSELLSYSNPYAQPGAVKKKDDGGAGASSSGSPSTTSTTTPRPKIRVATVDGKPGFYDESGKFTPIEQGLKYGPDGNPIVDKTPIEVPKLPADEVNRITANMGRNLATKQKVDYYNSLPPEHKEQLAPELAPTGTELMWSQGMAKLPEMSQEEVDQFHQVTPEDKELVKSYFGDDPATQGKEKELAAMIRMKRDHNAGPDSQTGPMASRLMLPDQHDPAIDIEKNDLGKLKEGTRMNMVKDVLINRQQQALDDLPELMQKMKHLSQQQPSGMDDTPLVNRGTPEEQMNELTAQFQDKVKLIDGIQEEAKNLVRLYPEEWKKEQDRIAVEQLKQSVSDPIGFMEGSTRVGNLVTKTIGSTEMLLRNTFYDPAKKMLGADPERADYNTERMSDFFHNLQIPEDRKPFYDTKTGKINWTELVPNVMEQGAVVAMLGSGNPSSLGLFARSFAMQYEDYRRSARAAGMSTTESELFAYPTAAANSLIELISPEKELLPGAAKEMAVREYMQALGKGRGYAFRQATKGVLKIVSEQNLEEMMQNLSDAAAGYAANRMMGNDNMDQTVSMSDAINTAIVTTATSLLMGGASLNTKLPSKRAAWSVAAEHLPQFKQELAKMVQSEEITQQRADALYQDAFWMKQGLERVPPKISEQKRVQVAPLLARKLKIQEEAKAADKVFSERYVKQIENVDAQVKEVMRTPGKMAETSVDAKTWDAGKPLQEQSLDRVPMGIDIKYDGHEGVLAKDDEGNFVLKDGRKEYILPVADKNNVTETPKELGVKIQQPLTDEEFTHAVQGREVMGDVEYEGKKYFVSLANRNKDDNRVGDVVQGYGKSRMHFAPFGKAKRLEIVNKFLEERGLPARDKLYDPTKKEEPQSPPDITPQPEAGSDGLAITKPGETITSSDNSQPTNIQQDETTQNNPETPQAAVLDAEGAVAQPDPASPDFAGNYLQNALPGQAAVPAQDGNVPTATETVSQEPATVPEPAPVQEEAKPAEEPLKKEAKAVIAKAGFGFNIGKGDVVESIKEFARAHLRARGLLPKDAYALNERREGQVNSMLRNVKYTVADFRRIAKKAYGGKLTAEAMRDIDEFLKGNTSITSVPAEVQEVVKSMRNQIDALTREMIKEGIAEGDLAARLDENLGVYVTRSYQIFDDPKWAEKVPAEVKSKAEAFIREQYQQKGVTLPQDEIDGIINDMLYEKDAPMSFLKEGRIGAKDLSILKHRGDIPVEIRELWGEYHNPLVNYARSMTKMASIVANHNFLTELKQSATGKYLFNTRKGIYHEPIAPEGSKTYSPLNGMYTTPKIAKAFQKQFAPENDVPWLRWYSQANGVVKYSKTIGSLTTHIRNMMGNVYFAVSNGHWRVDEFATAYRTITTDLLSLGKEAYRERYKRYLKLGVVGESVTGGELKAVLDDASKKMPQTMEDYFDGRNKRIAKKVIRGIADVYAAEDDFFKIFAFENERARYKKAFPGKTDEEIDHIAAENVRNTYPTYSKVPNAIKQLRKFPVVGTFVSFPSEVLRTTFNTAALAKKELSQKETRVIGAVRLAGLAASVSLPSAAALLSRAALGIGDDEDKDIRMFLPPWSRNSELVYIGNDKPGSYSYIDIGSVNPRSYLSRPVIALLKNRDLNEAGQQALREMYMPFFGEELLAGRLLDIARNKKGVNDQEVYNKELPVGDQLKEQAHYLSEAFEPGTLTSFRRIWKGVNGTTDYYGKTYDPVDEVVATFSGHRLSTVDMGQALRFKGFDVEKRLTEARQIFTKEFYRTSATQEEMRTAYGKANEATGQIMREFGEQIDAAERSGIDPKEVRAIIKRLRLTNKDQKALRTGEFDGIKLPKGAKKALGL